MSGRSNTLQVGDVAPEFELAAANSDKTVSLTKLRRRGPVIVEFMRGTW